MKKFVFSLFLAFIVFATASAQKESEHLTFKGVPIDGSLSEFVAKIEKVGFVCIKTEDVGAYLKGDFAGCRNCEIIVEVGVSNKVCAVCVVFPGAEIWALLENHYMDLKSMLTKKYGKPSDCEEIFQGDYPPETDIEKLTMLRLGECTWHTTYTTPKGDIKLLINNLGGMLCFVGLVYSDKINTDAVNVQAMDDL